MQKTAYEMRISDWSSDVCSSDLWRCWNRRWRRTARPEARAGVDGLRLPCGGGASSTLPMKTEPRALDQLNLALDPATPLSLQHQLRQQLVDAMHRAVLRPGQRLPSSRQLAERSEEHTSELQSLMRTSYSLF